MSRRNAKTPSISGHGDTARSGVICWQGGASQNASAIQVQCTFGLSWLNASPCRRSWVANAMIALIIGLGTASGDSCHADLRQRRAYVIRPAGYHCHQGLSLCFVGRIVKTVNHLIRVVVQVIHFACTTFFLDCELHILCTDCA